MSYNYTTSTVISSEVSNTIVVLNLLSTRFVNHLPLVFAIFGLIGFIGNSLTYLQRELRWNTCCIYSLCGSLVDVINLFYNSFAIYLSGIYGIYIPWIKLPSMCKLYIFLIGFLPHLSINFLLMSVIDRYASTCKLTSSIRHLNKLKMVPRLIGITIIFSILASVRACILYEYQIPSGCVVTQPVLNGIIYIVINGISQPMAMLIFVLLTFRNVRRSRQRVGGTATLRSHHSRNQFMAMIFLQVLVTAFISLQWIITYTYYIIPINGVRTAEQTAIISFAYSLTNKFYYLNNVKSFYLSLLSSRFFRQTFIKALIRVLPRRVCQRRQILQANISMMTATKVHQQRTTAHELVTTAY
ncbi:unnamed protein product [Adineta steineri]|uniref:G-protein coupled receptors family 1 profile domain-containing protein n=1 Tax=Adineta steineri TaxID=433720 RepID=A0A815A1D0_9BILA|nr:unnamed protein product [Adineta steineri]CAF1349427.1 unnamed protein product [Adineta steineri]CAF1536194.1 unnamed protein product [Adineta steineri]CAF1596091.1 unnamed protein product [Adineta steineri]